MDALPTAVREIAETKALVERLITSSESFDYPQAKIVLKQLDRKVRSLGKLQAKLQRRQETAQPNICVVDFKVPALAGSESGL